MQVFQMNDHVNSMLMNAKLQMRPMITPYITHETLMINQIKYLFHCCDPLLWIRLRSDWNVIYAEKLSDLKSIIFVLQDIYNIIFSFLHLISIKSAQSPLYFHLHIRISRNICALSLQLVIGNQLSLSYKTDNACIVSASL